MNVLKVMWFLLLLVITSAVSPALAACHCGYKTVVQNVATDVTSDVSRLALLNDAASLNTTVHTLNVHTNPSDNIGSFTEYTWTDLLETDFLHLDSIADDTDWTRQNYSVSADNARGPFG